MGRRRKQFSDYENDRAEKVIEREKSIAIKKAEAENLKIKIMEMLDEEQKIGFEQIRKGSLNLILGQYGTGKSLLAVAYAALALKENRADKIFLSRPVYTKTSEQIGFVSGDKDQKMAMFLMPLLQNFEKFFNKTEIEYFISHGQIEMLPTMYLRGMNIDRHQILIIDEAQNLDHDGMKKAVTRIANGGKIILAADRRQTDLRSNESGLQELIDFKRKVNYPTFNIIELTVNHRDPIVQALADFYDSFS
jgi:phosphate starvation-inducible protein PhoH